MHTKFLNRICLALLGAIFVLSNIGCSEQVAGGPCKYSDFAGKATITELKPHEDQSQDKGYWIVFDTKFSGEKATPAIYNHKGHRVLIKNPSGKTDEAWLTAQGVSVNAELDVEVAIITSGTCTPIIFKFYKLPAGSVQD